jgi:endonuclease YncB( thermonuclease family)
MHFHRKRGNEIRAWMKYFGKEAAALTRRTVEGKRVRLEFDAANTARAHMDSTQQRRTLGYVFLKDGTLLNAEIIKQGTASPIHVFLLHGWRS